MFLPVCFLWRSELTSSLSQCSSAQSTFSSHTSIASNLSTGSNTSAAAPAHVVSAATASDNTVTSGTADVATGIAIPAKQGSSRSGGDAAAAAGDGDSSSSESDVMGGLLAHEHILTLNDLLANVENSLEYDSSVVYEVSTSSDSYVMCAVRENRKLRLSVDQGHQHCMAMLKLLSTREENTENT